MLRMIPYSLKSEVVSSNITVSSVLNSHSWIRNKLLIDQ